MNQLRRIWNSLSTSQRISLTAAPALVCAIAFGLVRWAHENDFRTLYSSLAPEDASAVTQKIREAGIEYRLDETGATILVPSARLAEARLALAGAGMPRTGRIGFELFDRANLGASDFTEQVNYRRALEGELERTVTTLAEIDQARIHVTFAKESVFLDTRQPAKATVVVKLRHVGQLQASNIAAIANLVASAVDGLSPEAVAIIDANGRLLNRPRSTTDTDAQAADANLDYRRQLESEYTARINSALEPLLGAGRFRTGVNAECDFTSTEESDEHFESSGSTVLTSQTSEESTSSGTVGGSPGTASNLPQPAPRAARASPGILRKTENITYQPSRTVRRTVSPRGSVRRVSTAILIDQTLRWDGIGAKAKKTLVQPSAEVMKGVRDIVAGITGYNEQRGDQITVETLPFESTLSAEPPLPSSPLPKRPSTFDLKNPLLVSSTAMIVLLLGAVLFLLVRRQGSGPATPPHDMAASPLAPAPKDAALIRESPDRRLEQQLADTQAAQAQLEAETLGRIKLAANTKKGDVLARHLRESIQKDPVNAANVLRTWVSDVEPKRS